MSEFEDGATVGSSKLSREDSMRITVLAAIVTSALVASVSAQDSEKKIRMRDAPPAVQQAIKQQSEGATLLGVSKEVENGKTLYEAELRINGHSKDVTFDAGGRVLSVEEETTLDQIPGAARDAIQKAAAGGQVGKLEAVTESGRKFFEAQIKVGGKRSEVKVDTAGQPVR